MVVVGIEVSSDAVMDEKEDYVSLIGRLVSRKFQCLGGGGMTSHLNCLEVQLYQVLLACQTACWLSNRYRL